MHLSPFSRFQFVFKMAWVVWGFLYRSESVLRTWSSLELVVLTSLLFSQLLVPAGASPFWRGELLAARTPTCLLSPTMALAGHERGHALRRSLRMPEAGGAVSLES